MGLSVLLSGAPQLGAQQPAPPIPAVRTFAHNEIVQMMEHPPSGYGAVELRPMVVRAEPETRLHAMFVFPGQTLTRPPGQVSLAIIVRAAATQFADSPSVQLIADDTPPMQVAAAIRQIEGAGAGRRETVAMRVPRAMFLRLASAKRAMVRIDGTILPLGYEQLEALRDLASRMSPEGHRAALARVPVRDTVEDFTLRRTAFESPQVDSAARPAMVLERPRFPKEAPRETRRLFIHYVVDTAGRVEIETLSSRAPAQDSLFLASLRAVMPRWEFTPATRRGSRVRQVVRQVMVFDPADEGQGG
jgi:hypothetical protein